MAILNLGTLVRIANHLHCVHAKEAAGKRFGGPDEVWRWLDYFISNIWRARLMATDKRR